MIYKNTFNQLKEQHDVISNFMTVTDDDYIIMQGKHVYKYIGEYDI